MGIVLSPNSVELINEKLNSLSKVQNSCRMFGEFDSVLHTNLFTTEQNTAESVRESLDFHYRTKRVEMEGRFGTVLPSWEIVPIKIK